MNRKKWILATLLVGLVIALLGYNYIYQDHRDIASEAPDYTISATELTQAFQKNEETATKKYLNKTVLVEGVVNTINSEGLTIEPSVFFALSEKEVGNPAVSKATTIKVKGRCIGYDNLLEEIKFDQASIQD
jgi:hypothetical protein